MLRPHVDRDSGRYLRPICLRLQQMPVLISSLSLGWREELGVRTFPPLPCRLHRFSVFLHRHVPRQGCLAALSKKSSGLIHESVSLTCHKSYVTLQTPPSLLGDVALLGWKLPSAPETRASKAYVIALLGSPVLNHPFSMARAMWESNTLGNEGGWCFALVVSVPDTIDLFWVTLPHSLQRHL